MSKIDKNIQVAREWRKKHEADFPGLDQALAQWENQMKLLEEALSAAFAARKATIASRKAVQAALVAAKVARKTAPNL